MLAAWGRLVHRHRWPVLAASALSAVAWLGVLGLGLRFDHALLPEETEAGQALALLARELPRRAPSFHLLFAHPALPAADRRVREAVEQALAPLGGDPRVRRIRTAWEVSPPDPERFSRDGRYTLVTVELQGSAPAVESLLSAGPGAEAYADLTARVRPGPLTVLPAGPLALYHDFTRATRRDVLRAELAILPVVPGLLLLVFGSVVAAALPLGVGLLAVAAGMGAMALLARVTSVSVYAVNVVSMIGLAVAVDYSLFIVSRFREEIARAAPAEALGRTLATAGQAVLFSGLTVAVGLGGLLLLGLGNLGSIGLAGTGVVLAALLYGLTFLPALLAVLGPRVDAGRLPFRGRPGLGGAPAPERSRGFWVRLTAVVMAHPWKVLVPVSLGLLLLGAPLLWIRLAATDLGVLPAAAESRRGEDLLRRQFPGGAPTRILVVVDFGTASPRAAGSVARLWDLSRWLRAQPGVSRVESFVDLDPGLPLSRYQMLAAMPLAALPPAIQGAAAATLGPHAALLVVQTPYAPTGEEARDLVRRIRAGHPPGAGRVLVTGQTALDLDLLALVRRQTPLVAGVVVLATCVLLFLLLRSVLLPLKAVVMNALSITASYGALVWVFQDGYLAGWLGVVPGPIETVTPLIMFCVVFGLSMDYGVLLLSRIREEWLRTGDSTLAVGLGLERTGRLVTAAAAIMAAIFFAFALADLVVIKAIGVGMGIAVVVDATVVRALLVPATMRLLGRWNWWAPDWLGGGVRRGP